MIILLLYYFMFKVLSFSCDLVPIIGFNPGPGLLWTGIWAVFSKHCWRLLKRIVEFYNCLLSHNIYWVYTFVCNYFIMNWYKNPFTIHSHSLGTNGSKFSLRMLAFYKNISLVLDQTWNWSVYRSMFSMLFFCCLLYLVMLKKSSNSDSIVVCVSPD